MGTLALTDRSNIYDIMQMKAPDSKGALEVTNTLTETNDLINDLDALPSNGSLFHQGLRVTSLPSGSLVDVGGTWASSKSAREPFVDVLATIRDSWEVNEDELQVEGDEITAALVLDEQNNHEIGLGQAWANLIVHGPTTPTQNAIVGLMGRAPWLSIDNEFTFGVGGTGSYLRSAWLVWPSPTTVHLLYNPNNPTLGVKKEDMGRSREVDQAALTKHRWIRTIEFMLQMGLCIRDQRGVKRICNAACGAGDYPGEDVVNAAITAYCRHSNFRNKPAMLYCDTALYTKLVLASNNKTFVYTSDQNIYRVALPMISPNIIIRQLDALEPLTGTGETILT